MKSTKILAVALSLAMVFSSIISVSAAPPLTPPSNSAVKVITGTMSKFFNAANDTWDQWDTQGVSATKEFVAGAMENGHGAVKVKGGNFPFVMLDNFGGSFSSYDEIKMYVKSNYQTAISFKERYHGRLSDIYTIPSTGGVWKEVSLVPANFYGKTETSITEEDYKAIKSKYNGETSQYDSVAMMYVNSTETLIGDINCFRYDYTTESSVARESITSDFNTSTWAFWGSWTDGGTVKVPISSSYTEGAAEDGVGKALVLTGGNQGSGSYGGGQFLIPNTWDLTGADALRVKYKSTKNVSVMLRAQFKAVAGTTVPEQYRGFMASHIDSEGKLINAVDGPGANTASQTLPSTNGEWKTIDLKIDSFNKDGKYNWVKSLRTIIDFTNFAPAALFRFDGLTFGNSGGITIESVSAIWYEKRPSVSAISFTNGGFSSNEGIDVGTTDVNLTLKNDAAVDCEDVILVAALYDITTNKLKDIDLKVVTVPALGTLPSTLSVTIPDDEDYMDYKINVMLWDGADTIDQITNLATLDAWGYITE